MFFKCSNVDMSDERTGQSMHTALKYIFADSGKMRSGVVILGLVLALVLAQEMQDNRPQHLIYVRLADQVSLYNHQICRPRFLTSPEGHGETPCLNRILKFCEKWREDQSTLTFVI